MTDDIKDTFEWFKIVSAIIDSMNNKKTDWKEDLFVEFVLHKIRGYNFEKLTPLNHLSNLELIKLLDSYEG